MFQEFKKFAMRGNVLELAVGVIIGGAFGKIVTSLVNDMIMPILGLVVGKIDLSGLKWPQNAAEGEFAIKYGMFMQSVIDFLIIAFSIFMLIKFINRLKKKEEKEEKAKEEKPSREELLLQEIRDILKERS